MAGATNRSYRIFLVEDDDDLAGALRAALERYDYAVSRAREYERVAEEFARVGADLVVLDVNLPKYDGFHVCRAIRSISPVPVLFISARDGSMDQVMGLSSGGDDYLTKPFPAELLLAKVGALLRRSYELGPAERELLEHDGLVLDLTAATVRTGEAQIDLSRNELRMLAALMRRRGEVVARDELIEAVWHRDAFIDDNTLTVNVNRLRKRLAEIGRPDAIVTRKQQGYLLR